MKDPFDQDTHDFMGSLAPLPELVPPVRREPVGTADNTKPYPDSFKDYPRSIADVKSDKTNSAADWSPRDVLIDLLRDIDAGRLKPDALMVIWTKMEGDGANTSRRTSSPNSLITQGMIADMIRNNTR